MQTQTGCFKSHGPGTTRLISHLLGVESWGGVEDRLKKRKKEKKKKEETWHPSIAESDDSLIINHITRLLPPL